MLKAIDNKNGGLNKNNNAAPRVLHFTNNGISSNAGHKTAVKFYGTKK